MRIPVSIIGLLLPISALALNFDAELPYSDIPQDAETRIAVGALTDEGILEGHPDGTFRDLDLLNRAEFMKIAMALVNDDGEGELIDLNTNCFPDVSSDAWFAAPVCYAKYLGIVSGNAIIGVDPDEWFFEPSRSVQYEEALKILIGIYETRNPLRCYSCLVDWAGEWYVPYVVGAEDMGIVLEGLKPGHKVTRGEIARLVLNVLAFESGELDLLRAAEQEAEFKLSDQCKPYVCDDGATHPSCTEDGHQIMYLVNPCQVFVPSKCAPIVCDDGRKFASCNSLGEQLFFTGGTPCFNEAGFDEDPIDSPQADAVYDPDTDLSTDASFLLLGNTTPVLGSIEVFNNSEPFDVSKITIIFTAGSSLNSVQAIHVYDEDGLYLGRANKDSSAGNRHFVLNLKSGSWSLEKREERYIYVRAQLSEDQQGGVSGEELEVSAIQIEGSGMWSNKTYNQSTTDDFNSFQTGRSDVIGITNAGAATDLLVAGTNILIGEFRFEGRTVSGTADLEITDIVFTIGANDDVAVSNMQLGSEGSTDRINCTIVSNKGTCSTIPDYLGSFEKAPRIIQIFGDVTIPAGALRPSLQLSINNPGSIGSAGDLTWTDGSSSFTWVPTGTPVVRGTYFNW
ncbi:S-layer homology domain-containing protein [Patescibacteria group bacterium]|nr:S-layer homology domain-containing protein [Patescibacteria group bacterium]MBU1123138.1 S-layer homology domain-containing protein [Patescibacteria group bacterium]MBU1910997.1 S-layer homology domain-containing protein [Patescibacteria group bacterium]